MGDPYASSHLSTHQIVRAAENLLHNWHHIAIDHGPLDFAQRAQCRQALIDVALEYSKGRGLELSLKEGTIEFAIGPPDGISVANDIVEAIQQIYNTNWEVRQWAGSKYS